MCGIVGYVRLRGEAAFDIRRHVESARDRLAHRGPDDAGLYISPDGRCVLGFRRLSILDLSSAGHQPMANEDGTLWIVFNGEIYNYVELRRQLSGRGHCFRSSTDTEVILHLFEEAGPDLLRHLDGMFAFVIYDARRGRLFGARDRLGIKPLYYALAADRFAFASEPKALLALPDVSAAPEPDELTTYLTFNCVPGPRTLHRDIAKLEPGTLFELEAEGGFKTRRYWTPPGEAQAAADASGGLSARLDRHLCRATAKRMISDVPFGAMLSGGVDSSLTVALMSEALGSPVRTFTVGYPGDDRDEDSDLSHARRVARYFGSDHHEVILSEEEISGTLDELPALADDPIGAPSVTANLHVARFTRRCGVTVAQVGEGADEVFCGYEQVHRLWRLHERFAFLSNLLPKSAAGGLARALGPLLERVGDPSLIGALDGTVAEQLRRHARGEHLFWGHGVLFTPTQQRRLLPNVGTSADPYRHLDRRLVQLESFDRLPYLDQLALIDIVLGLPERLLMRVDKATMLHSVEARVPFLDPEVVGFAFSIPPRVRASTAKGFLKSYAAGKLPPEIITRRKVGFPTAQSIFLAPEVLSRIRSSVLDSRFLDLTHFDSARLEELFRASDGRRSRYFYHIWSLYVLSLWYHHWVEGGDG
jgi:asparagine synthase (glutamine-hydrolysing)